MGTPDPATLDNHAILLLRQQLNIETTLLNTETAHAEKLRSDLIAFEALISERRTRIDQCTNALRALGETTDTPPTT